MSRPWDSCWPGAVSGRPLNGTDGASERVLLHVKNTGNTLPENERKRRKTGKVCVCVCPWALAAVSCLCSSLQPFAESFVSLIRFIVVAEIAGGDLVLFEFVYRWAGVSQRNGRKGERLDPNKEMVHGLAWLMEDWKAFMNTFEWTMDREGR